MKEGLAAERLLILTPGLLWSPYYLSSHLGLLYVPSVTPLSPHMLLECHLLHQCPVLLVIC